MSKRAGEDLVVRVGLMIQEIEQYNEETETLLEEMRNQIGDEIVNLLKNIILHKAGD